MTTLRMVIIDVIDWMHETARCFGYPSDSTRTARELARKATRGHRRRRPGPVRPGPGLLHTPSQAASTRPRGSTLRCDAHRPCGSTPRRDASRPCGSSLAGVGHRALAIGHGCPVGLRAGVPDRRPVSPLSSPSGAVGRARAGAAGRGSPTAPCITGARRQSEPALSCAQVAGPSHCGGPPAPRGCASLGVTGLSAATQVLQLGTTVVSPSAKLASCPGRADRARPSAATGQPRTGQGPVPRAWARGPPATHLGQGLLTSGRRRQRRIRPRAPPSQRPGAGQRAARNPGRQSRSDHGQCTPRSRLTPVRAESARQAPAEQRA
jgi:hypothetical protein